MYILHSSFQAHALQSCMQACTVPAPYALPWMPWVWWCVCIHVQMSSLHGSGVYAEGPLPSLSPSTYQSNSHDLGRQKHAGDTDNWIRLLFKVKPIWKWSVEYSFYLHAKRAFIFCTCISVWFRDMWLDGQNVHGYIIKLVIVGLEKGIL